MSKKTKEEAPKMADPSKKKFYLPTFGVTIEASSQEEAIRLATEQKDEGGDGNS